MSGKVYTHVYGHTDVWKTRKEAIEYFKNCCKNSEGAERERYVGIMIQLLDGQTFATDGD